MASIEEKVNDSFQSFTLKLNRKISAEELSSKFKFIASSKNFGTILRAKGIVQLLNGQYGQFDFSLNEYNIEKIDYNDENIISFIGVDINKKELEHFFKWGMVNESRFRNSMWLYRGW